ncbi:translation initiation factor IF-3 [Mycoplasma marinum]|uniref:Translation initiation factor IF-3 n=2 Tax=Mycoplasma marinum TaxID=1937190 RepID=A0A4R0XMR0_9MOLU|nr:translation initiation factor IF-3 [Mycoplasma marinum]
MGLATTIYVVWWEVVTPLFYIQRRFIIARIHNRKKPKSEHLVNRDIPYPKVFVIDDKGEKLGVMPTRAAIEKAKDAGFDLVIISANPKQPVAKILDYGKFKYERKKKRKEAKAKQVVTNNREVRLTPMIGDHDLKVKAKKAREFIMAGDRVKVSLKFRGREMARQELGHDTLKRFFNEIEDIALITKKPQLNSRFLDMYIQRDNKKKPKEAENGKNEN